MGFENFNAMPAEEPNQSERIDDVEKAEVMAHAGDSWRTSETRFNNPTPDQLERGHFDGGAKIEEKELYARKAGEHADLEETRAGNKFDQEK